MSRFDSVGMFWEDYAQVRERTERVRAAPPIPETGWVPPREFPDLAGAAMLSVDTETKDLNLLTKGPGAARGDGHLVGIAVGVPEGKTWYFPMRHEVCGELNLDPDAVLRWARDQLCRPGQPKVGANLLYDIEFLQAEGVPITGPFYDVQVAAPLLDEYRRSYSLDSLAVDHLGEHKVDDVLYDWAWRAYGGKQGRPQAGNIYRCPPQLVGPYAQGDVDLPLRIFAQQKRLLQDNDLYDLFMLESRLVPLLAAMRAHGVRVNVDDAQRVGERLAAQAALLQQELGINVNAPQEVAALFDRLGLPYPKTAKGNPSFTKQFLTNHSHAVAEKIVALRGLLKNKGTFIDGYIMDHNVNGRLHCQFNQLKSDSYGTVSGRFSSSNPNLQNIPSRDDILAPLIRGLFIPEDGCQWRRFDWSQIEYRFLLHFAVGDSAEQFRQLYRSDPHTDFHVKTQEWIADFTGRDLGRKPTKNINFGLVYGMGEPTLANNLGIPLDAARPLFDCYHQTLPFVKETFNLASSLAANRGYVKTILGRKARFELWEPRKYMSDQSKADAIAAQGLPLDWFAPVRDIDVARERWGAVKRAHTHKALNRVLQGSSADAMKKAMVDMYEGGVFDDTGLPLLTVHDELDFNDPGTAASEAGFVEARRIMENCVPLKIPLIADEEVGPDWGHLK